MTSKRLIDEGVIGDVIEVHYYDGNRGPLWHTADKIELQPTAAQKAASWFYEKDGAAARCWTTWATARRLAPGFTVARAHRSHGDGRSTAGLDVDEHSVTIARYERGLSKFETRWGTFTDPWTLQPQPQCGFVIVGTEGTISSYDYQPTIKVQTHAHPEGEVLPVDVLQPPHQNPVQYVIHCIETGEALAGPLSPDVSRVGQQIVDTAVLSAQEKRTVALL